MTLLFALHHICSKLHHFISLQNEMKRSFLPINTPAARSTKSLWWLNFCNFKVAITILVWNHTWNLKSNSHCTLSDQNCTPLYTITINYNIFTDLLNCIACRSSCSSSIPSSVSDNWSSELLPVSDPCCSSFCWNITISLLL